MRSRDLILSDADEIISMSKPMIPGWAWYPLQMARLLVEVLTDLRDEIRLHRA